MTAHLHIKVPHAACTACNSENTFALEAPCVRSDVCHRMHRAHSSCAKQVSHDDALSLRITSACTQSPRKMDSKARE